MPKNNFQKVLYILVIAFFPSFSLAKNVVNFDVKRGDTLSSILRSADVGYSDITNALNSMGDLYDPSSIKAGQKIKVFFDIKNKDKKNPYLKSFEIMPSKLTTIRVTRVDDTTFKTTTADTDTQIKLVKASAIIENTFYGATKKAGIPLKIRNQLIKKLSYSVDFQRDIHKGNKIDLIYEALLAPDGKIVGSKDLIYYSLKLDNDQFDVYRYTTRDGKIDYYDKNGMSIKKTFLRTPIDGASITSTFGKRKHPILGYTKMHKGLDFGASLGTPIYAAGPGLITQIGENGAYGNYIKIEHNGGYATAYAHLSNFSKNLKSGSKVEQGDVIGYVGSTGRSTGPHLHYEVLQHDQQINPLSIDIASINKLKGLEHGIFYQYKESINKLAMDMSKKNHYAAAPSPTRKN
jgi:murein DD-endopeptidase MepM/ murein hydrolase activator NlpD